MKQLEDLSKHGFHKYKDAFQCTSKNIEDKEPGAYQISWQKCYYDEDGHKKYFLNAHDWDFTQYKDYMGVSRNFECQVTRKDTGEAINLTFLSDNLSNAEGFIDTLFEAGLLSNYEEVY